MVLKLNMIPIQKTNKKSQLPLWATTFQALYIMIFITNLQGLYYSRFSDKKLKLKIVYLIKVSQEQRFQTHGYMVLCPQHVGTFCKGQQSEVRLCDELTTLPLNYSVDIKNSNYSEGTVIFLWCPTGHIWNSEIKSPTNKDMGYYFQNKSFGNFKLNKIKKIHPHAISGIQTQFNNLKNEKEKKE